MVQLMIAGATAEHYPGRLDLDGIAPRPSFEVEPLEVPLLLEGSVEFVRVVLGATVHDLRRRGLKWQYGWNRSLPASMGLFRLPPDSEHRLLAWSDRVICQQSDEPLSGS